MVFFETEKVVNTLNIRDNYNNIPWYISENGMGVEGEEKYIGEDGSIQDDYRIEFFEEHLQYLHKGIEEGSNCFGYIAVDLATQKKTIKKSGAWIKEVSLNNGF